MAEPTKILTFPDVFLFRTGMGLDEYVENAVLTLDQLHRWGYTKLVFEPGNGNRYDLYLVRTKRGYTTDGLMVAIPNWGKSAVFPESFCHVSYVSEKLGLRGPDAEPIANLLNAMFLRTPRGDESDATE